MPTYGYRCPACGHEYEKFQKISDSTRTKCPKCGKRGERLISGGAGLVFKGSGFYITDYKKAAEKKPAKQDKKDDKGSTKTEGGGSKSGGDES
jgi:putative FmdB family regulatory protein